MMTILFTNLTSAIPRILKRIDELPLAEQQRINVYQDKLRQAEKIAGRLLVKELLKAYSQDINLSLSDLQYHQSHPYLENPFHFSIAHSCGLVVCAACTESKIGIDVEAIKPVDLSLYTDYFTSNEWKFIDNNCEQFYDVWTKKEAVVKAMGKGIHINLNAFDVLNNEVEIEDNKIYIQKLLLYPNYSCHIATTKPLTPVLTKEVLL